MHLAKKTLQIQNLRHIAKDPQGRCSLVGRRPPPKPPSSFARLPRTPKSQVVRIKCVNVAGPWCPLVFPFCFSLPFNQGRLRAPSKKYAHGERRKVSVFWFMSCPPQIKTLFTFPNFREQWGRDAVEGIFARSLAELTGDFWASKKPTNPCKQH